MMNKRLKYIVIAFAIGVVILNVLPFMSTYVNGSEHGTVIVRGYNLIEFSTLGCIPLFATLLIPAILFSNHSKEFQNIELILLSIASIISYIHALNSAKNWLLSISDSIITHHLGMIVYPFSFLLLIIVSKFLLNVSSSYFDEPLYYEI